MRLSLEDGSCVVIDLRATGLLRAVGHDPTLRARIEPIEVEVGDAGAIDVALEARVRAASIEMPRDVSGADRDKMRDNMLSRDVLDAPRFPIVEFRGRYAGSSEAGRVSGEAIVRGQPRAIAFDVRVAREGEHLRATGTWEGALTHLGIRPFKALLGALKLDDWIRLRLDASFVRT